jgi:hypothetical protein
MYVCDQDTCDKVKAYKELQKDAEYREIAQAAYDAVMAAMKDGEQTHVRGEWKERSNLVHVRHALKHVKKEYNRIYTGNWKAEDHNAHAIARLAMIRCNEQKI